MRRLALLCVAPTVAAAVVLSGGDVTLAQRASTPEDRSPQETIPAPSTQPADGVAPSRSSNPHVTPESERVQREAKQRAAIRSARRAFGRAIALKDQHRRDAKLSQLLPAVSASIRVDRNNFATTTGLLILQARIQLELGDKRAAQETLRRQHAQYMRLHGDEAFTDWLSAEVERGRNLRNFDLAVIHLAASIADDPDSPLAAQYSLCIGDILTQRAYPNGPYDAAIQQYATVAAQCASRFSDIADDARLRQAKALRRNCQKEEADRLLVELTQSANDAVAEEARHYLKYVTATPASCADKDDPS